MHILKSALIGAASLLISTGAFAQDSGDWSGLYIGGVGGAQFGNSHFSLPGDKHDALKQSHADNTNFSGGGLVGFNFQSNNIVYGLEGDVTDGNGTQSVTACTVPDGCFTPKHDSFTTFNNLKTGVTERLRARLGISTGDMLFYAAGGYSHADTKLSLVGNCYNFADPPVPLVFNFARSRQVSGFNLGVGAEYALGSFFLRGEYVFDDYGSGTWKGSAEWNDRRISLSDNQLRVAVGIHI
jgi:outer membrane immunogenic protein